MAGEKAFLCGQKVGDRTAGHVHDNYAGPCGFYGCLRIFVGSLEDFEKAKQTMIVITFGISSYGCVAFPVTTALI